MTKKSVEKKSTATSSSDGKSYQYGKARQSKGIKGNSISAVVEEKDTFASYYMPTYFGSMKQCEHDYDWNVYMNKPMSAQHKFIAKLKMFCENRFDIVILGKKNAKNKMLGNMMFKCFLDPLGKGIEDHIGESYAEGRAQANITVNLDNTEETKMIKEMLSVKEDKIRYTQIKVVKLYGLGLRLHIAGTIDKSQNIAMSVAQQQMHSLANYLNFKKKYKSGFGINSFLIILDYDEKLTDESSCTIELLSTVFTVAVFNSTIFLIELDVENGDKVEQIIEEAKSNISQKACCKQELIEIVAIKPLTKGEAAVKLELEEDDCVTKEPTTVAATLKVFNAIARQTYIDPSPFEPDGADYHEALAMIETVKKKYCLKEKDWCDVINHVYTMVPN